MCLYFYIYIREWSKELMVKKYWIMNDKNGRIKEYIKKRVWVWGHLRDKYIGFVYNKYGDTINIDIKYVREENMNS